ncbi:Acn9p [Saccharomyces cerevisiae x Saccharomyces kudriavzevii VIN7]|uniref:Succinate dehydrogenase assembly factor 3 n=1 Tax=Saccharomyces cerevisiae x Saccharomyces kudriavzevii (strain VIN7) TaxID=1095631 RepID=H0GTI4_SACCK|nr:Acn9p [Saccharomyces cerevisiae x Saccharomyces kudriavzevii VIN7]
MNNRLIHRSVRFATHNSQLLLPPLVLYKRILRQHKMLPAPQREMGDQYVRNEFKLHKDIENPLHIVGFLASWQDYLHMISNGDWKDITLSSETLEKLSPEQVVQLYELMKETQKLRQDTKTESTKDIKGNDKD